MIYADPSELRDASVVPPGLLSQALPLSGLESTTGADFLVCTSPLDTLSTPVGKIVLRERLKSGTLIQRKSGGDFLASIDKLPEILSRMLEWDPCPWLVVTRIEEGPRDTVRVDGSNRRNNWRWSQVSAAMDAWQDRGGCLKVLSTDHDLTDWFRSREKRLFEYMNNPEREFVHKIKRQRVVERDERAIPFDAWPTGIGQAQLSRLEGHLIQDGKPATLANAIALACSDKVLMVNGWGKGSLSKVRAHYGVTHSTDNLPDGAPTWCLIYDWHEGVLIAEGDDLFRLERKELNE